MYLLDESMLIPAADNQYLKEIGAATWYLGASLAFSCSAESYLTELEEFM